MSSNTIEDLLDKITLEFNKPILFNQRKREMISKVIHELPEEIQRIASNFKVNGMDNIVTSENDFLLGTVNSFIYYKVLHYCSLLGNPLQTAELPILQTCLFANSSKLMDLIIKISGK